MQRLGKVLHVSDSKNLILRAEVLAGLGMRVADDKLREIGRVVDLFGPVDKPYVSVKSNVKDSGKYVGQIIYTLED